MHVEFVWKEFKDRVECQGLLAESPKEAARQAATIGLLTDPDKWISIILPGDLLVRLFGSMSWHDTSVLSGKQRSGSESS